MVQSKMMPAYNAIWHWAKIEPPEDQEALAAMRAALAARYPLERFNAARKRVDPDNILANDMVDKLIS
jgi:L-galactono-1,4-lactone dehydrogenase